MAYGETVVLMSPRAGAVNRPYWGTSSTADTTKGTTGLWFDATYQDLLGRGAASSSSSFDHLTAPAEAGANKYYDINFTLMTTSPAADLYVQRWPVGSTGSTLIQTLTTGAITLNKLYQFKVPIAAGEEWTVGLTVSASSASYSLLINPSAGL
jgi:hypothetical protein